MKQRRLWVLFVLFIGLVTAVLLSNTTQAVETNDSSSLVHSFDVPFTNGDPHKIIIEQSSSPAKLWFTMPDADAIGQLVITSTTDFLFQSYDAGANSEPFDLVLDDSNGYVYFTAHSGNSLKRINITTKSIDTYPLTAGGNGPMGVDIAPNGLIWLAQDTANRLSSFDPNTTNFTNYDYNVANGQPEDIDVLNNDEVWFTAPGVNNVVRLAVGSGTFSSNPLLIAPGTPTFPPGGVAVDSSFPWVSAPTEGLLLRFAPGTLSLWRPYDISHLASSPTAVAYQANGAQNQIWFVDTNNGKAGLLFTNSNGNEEAMFAMNLPGSNSQPTDIKAGMDGTIWIADNGSGTIIQWSSPYYNNLFLPLIVKNP